MKTSRLPVAGPNSIGLLALIEESRRVILPLKGVECDFSVLSGIAEVSMTQIFKQENERPLDCEYLFPLPADASVYFCEADINGRTIRAQVKEKEEACRLAEEKKAAGFRTALVQSERENLFTLSLGNVQPDDLIIIQLKYFQTLRFMGDQPSIEIPFCPGFRYIPGRPLLRKNKGGGVIDDTDQVPDASRITPVRIDSLHPDAAYVDLRGSLDARFVNKDDLRSPSHSILVDQAKDQLRVTLSDKSEVPDRDFVLRWREQRPETTEPRAWTRQTNEHTYALLEIRAPKQTADSREAVDFYFLVDRSGSMAGEKWNKAAEALLSCLHVLRPDDRAMVTFFANQFQDFAERPLCVAELLKDEQLKMIRNLGAGGGTELRPALEHVLEIAAQNSQARIRNLILITDAQIGNEPAILKLMQSAPDLPVHCFGIDVALNDALLLALCRQQGGTFHSLNPGDDIAQAMTALGKTLGQPVLLDMQLSDGWEIPDAKIPNLYAGQVHYLSARCRTKTPLSLVARGCASQPVQINFETHAIDLGAPYLHWCRRRIQRFLAENKNIEAIDLSINSNQICPLTAFIAWDEVEKVVRANHKLPQPNVVGEVTLLSRLHGYAASQPTRDSFPDVIKQAWSPRSSVGFFTRHDGPPNEIELRRELSELCNNVGVPKWRVLIKAIFDWVAAEKDVRRAERVKAVNLLVDAVRTEARNLNPATNTPQENRLEAARDRIRVLLEEFIEASLNKTG